MINVSPNVLLITADQLRYDCIGSSGKYKVQTPGLDLFAGQSVRFTNAYSHIPVCCPARQSLLHGRRAETFGALWNYNGALPIASLQPDAYTWTKTLVENGYATAFLGKWGVHPTLDPTSFGYESYVSEADYRRFQQFHYPNITYRNGYFGETNPIPLEDSSTHWFANQAAACMKRLQTEGKPWHMAMHFAEPHLPCRPSGRFADMYDPAAVPAWSSFKETFKNKPYIQRQQLYNWGVEEYTWENWAPIVARYYGIISQLDEAISTIFHTLEELGAAENTIVIFTADHGDMCGSHRMMDKHYILYDDVVHVPLLIRLPSQWQGGVSCNQFVYNFLDLPPTLLEILDLNKYNPGNLQGRSLVSLLSGKENSAQEIACNDNTVLPNWRDSIVSSYNGQQFGLYTQRMIRTNHWKYIWNPKDTDEMYDLCNDPDELHNRIGDPEISHVISSLRQKLYLQLSADEDALVANEWMCHQLLHGAKL
jgi:arylsulfatase A-like enzyme